jgi:hypothetical protein
MGTKLFIDAKDGPKHFKIIKYLILLVDLLPIVSSIKVDSADNEDGLTPLHEAASTGVFTSCFFPVR